MGALTSLPSAARLHACTAWVEPDTFAGSARAELNAVQVNKNTPESAHNTRLPLFFTLMLKIGRIPTIVEQLFISVAEIPVRPETKVYSGRN
jgi:hypothetical protein